MPNTKAHTPVASPITIRVDDDLEREEPAGAQDETWSDVQQRERCGKAREKLDANLKGEHATAVYRSIACRTSLLTHAQYRVLDGQLSFTDRLMNCFPSRKKLLHRVGGSIRSLAALDKILGQLTRKGWEKRRELSEGDCVATPEGRFDMGILEEANRSGRFISAVGVVFYIPPNVLAAGDPGWEGPIEFGNRRWGQRGELATTGST